MHLRLIYHNAVLEASHKRLVEELGIAEHVEFVGILGPNELAEEYRRADLLVLPSFADCLPSVVTEALLCGTPVVAGAVCGVPEQVGEYGRVVPPGDAAAVAEAIASVLSDRPRFRGLAAEMRAYAARKFNPRSDGQDAIWPYTGTLSSGKSFHPEGKGWLDPVARLAVRAYWARRSRIGR